VEVVNQAVHRVVAIGGQPQAHQKTTDKRPAEVGVSARIEPEAFEEPHQLKRCLRPLLQVAVGQHTGQGNALKRVPELPYPHEGVSTVNRWMFSTTVLTSMFCLPKLSFIEHFPYLLMRT
jgi:hypothetical protein